jgi:hypothetical protein
MKGYSHLQQPNLTAWIAHAMGGWNNKQQRFLPLRWRQ